MNRRVREVSVVDLDGILDVERATKGEIGRVYLEGELYNPISRFYLIEEIPGGRILAYLIAWQLDERDFELHHLATLPVYQRTGLGRMLIEHLMRIHGARVCRIFLEVREGNRQAIAFYEGFGFLQVGRRKDYYRDPIEDALVYQYSISVER